MDQYIINLFQDMSLLTVALLGAGLLLCVVEVFLPKFGLSGILGIALIGTGMSSYYIDGFKVKQMVGLLAIITLILAMFIVIELILESKGIIKNPDRYRLRTYNEPYVTLRNMVGRVGKAITNIDLGGTIEIDGKLYYAVSNIIIVKGSMVSVIGVQNNSLVVKIR